MITFVTAFYKLDERSCCTTDMYLNYFKSLANTGIHIHLFIQPTLYNKYLNTIGQKDTIHVTQLEFEDLQFYKQLYGKDLNLPTIRNEEKDTRDYMILINSKIEFVKKSIDANIFNTNTFAWIDFGIQKVIKRDDTLIKLKNSQFQKKGLCMPVILPIQTNIDFSSVCWRHAGGFFIGDKESMLHFWEVYNKYFIKVTKQFNILTWEVNIWAYFELIKLIKPITYYADHNDSLLSYE